MPTSHDILKSDIRVYFEKNVNVSNRYLKSDYTIQSLENQLIELKKVYEY